MLEYTCFGHARTLERSPVIHIWPGNAPSLSTVFKGRLFSSIPVRNLRPQTILQCLLTKTVDEVVVVLFGWQGEEDEERQKSPLCRTYWIVIVSSGDLAASWGYLIPITQSLLESRLCYGDPVF